MESLQDQLDESVSKTIQDALNKIDVAEIDGLLYDEDAMESFRQTLLQDTDYTIAEISDRSLRKFEGTVALYKDIAQQRKQFNANKNKF
jgi:hypothetical protein